MKDVFWIELRRSPARWWSLPFAAIIGIYLFSVIDRWYAIGSQASVAAQIGVGLGAAVATAAAAWTGVQRTRFGQDEQLAVGAKHPWLREALPLAAVVVHMFIPIVAAFVLVTVINLSWGRAGAVWPTYIWLTMATVLLAVSTGYLFGRILPSPFTVAAAALTMAVVVLAGTDIERFALVTLYGYPDLRLSWFALAPRIALAAAVTIIAIGVGAWKDWTRSKPIRPGFGAAAAAILVLAGVTAVGVSGPLQVERDYVGGAPCTDTDPTVCVWYEHEKYLPMMERYVERFNELDEFLALPDELYSGKDEFWEAGMRGEVGDQLTFFGGGFGAASSMVHYAMRASDFPGCTLQDDGPDVDRLGKLEWNLTDWFTAYIMEVGSTAEMGVYAPGLDEVDPILEMSEQRQLEWVRASIEELREHCVD